MLFDKDYTSECENGPLKWASLVGLVAQGHIRENDRKLEFG